MDSYDFWYAITQGCDLPINLRVAWQINTCKVFVVKISVVALQIHVKYRDGITDSL